MSAIMIAFNACNDDDDQTPDRPTITVPSGIQPVSVDGMKDLTFTIKIPGGFASSSHISAGGTFAVPSPLDLEVGDKEGTITGVFKAGDDPGAGAVTLTVTDQNGKTDTETIALEITPVSQAK
ncbi:hypothetical protein DMA11_02710 [Marinilabiliaceae bacterium JC017]|nr:hypothetical protein DMA11_02710 [Marinilabiliaceae bacterium JC017]